MFKLLLAFFVLAGCTTLHSPVGDRRGSLSVSNFSSRFGTREFALYMPSTNDDAPLPLVVMLHGCLQTAADFARGTRMNEIAEQKKFAVLYPEQPRSQNQITCWNWFLPQNQKRDSGEPGLLVELVRKVVATHNIDSSRVFVAGLSAGGGMTSVLLACYPDVFAAGAVHSGVGYAFARNNETSLKAMKGGATPDLKAATERAKNCFVERKTVPRVLVLHGDLDDVAYPINGKQIAEQFTLLHQSAGEIKIKTMRIPHGPTSREVVQTDALYAEKPVVRRLEIRGLKHAWSGGDASLPFNDAQGPDSSELISSFFLLP